MSNLDSFFNLLRFAALLFISFIGLIVIISSSMMKFCEIFDGVLSPRIGNSNSFSFCINLDTTLYGTLINPILESLSLSPVRL